MPHPHVLKASRDHRRRLGLYGAPTVDWWDPHGLELSIWAAYQPKDAASLAASYTDLSGNNHDAGVGVAPTWDAINGWKGNDLDQYLTTAFVPADDQSQSFLVQFTNCSDVQAAIFGMNNGSNKALTAIPRYTGNHYYGNGGGARALAGVYAAGNMGVAGNRAYYNGVAEGAVLGPWGGAAVLPCLILCRNGPGGVPEHFTAAYIQALAIYDTALTAAQVLTIATAMAAL